MSDKNKKAAIAYFEKAINEFDPATAIALYGGPSYKQHNPLIEDGWDGLTNFVGWLHASFPNAHLDIKRAFADGDFVVLHSEWVRTPGQRGEAVADIVRFEQGKIIEHWDVIQQIPETAKNNNSMF
jgi:predicted SnoaL-like aldol condensation-catalyzing enzyme